MEKNINFQLKLEEIIKQTIEQKKNEGRIPSLLLHSCCAPCSSYVLEYLSDYFQITIFYYNPNISERSEYEKRVKEQKRLIEELPVKNRIFFKEGNYNPTEYDRAVAGLEQLGERSKRCYSCYRLRLEKTAMVAQKEQFDFFTTTLSISPYKNAIWINEIGEELEEFYQVPFLYSDFKKKNGYKRSIELSTKYNLYRQDFCGCKYSKEEERIRKLNR